MVAVSALRFPAGSFDRRWKTCAALYDDAYMRCGLVHVAHAPPSSAHSTVAAGVVVCADANAAGGTNVKS